jgi:hypothetical protein
MIAKHAIHQQSKPLPPPSTSYTSPTSLLATIRDLTALPTLLSSQYKRQPLPCRRTNADAPHPSWLLCVAKDENCYALLRMRPLSISYAGDFDRSTEVANSEELSGVSLIDQCPSYTLLACAEPNP